MLFFTELVAFQEVQMSRTPNIQSSGAGEKHRPTFSHDKRGLLKANMGWENGCKYRLQEQMRLPSNVLPLQNTRGLGVAQLALWKIRGCIFSKYDKMSQNEKHGKTKFLAHPDLLSGAAPPSATHRRRRQLLCNR